MNNCRLEQIYVWRCKRGNLVALHGSKKCWRGVQCCVKSSQHRHRQCSRVGRSRQACCEQAGPHASETADTPFIYFLLLPLLLQRNRYPATCGLGILVPEHTFLLREGIVHGTATLWGQRALATLPGPCGTILSIRVLRTVIITSIKA